MPTAGCNGRFLLAAPQSVVSRRMIQALAELVGLLVGIKQKRPERRLFTECLAERAGLWIPP